MPFRMAHGVHGGITKHIQVVHIVKFIVIVLVKELGKSVSSKVNMPFRMAHVAAVDRNEIDLRH